MVLIAGGVVEGDPLDFPDTPVSQRRQDVSHFGVGGGHALAAWAMCSQPAQFSALSFRCERLRL